MVRYIRLQVELLHTAGDISRYPAISGAWINGIEEW